MVTAWELPIRVC